MWGQARPVPDCRQRPASNSPEQKAVLRIFCGGSSGKLGPPPGGHVYRITASYHVFKGYYDNAATWDRVKEKSEMIIL
jgi:hypothetical protein